MLKGKLEGLKLSIVDENIIEDLDFSGDSVIATIGTKDNAVCAPILDYEITGNDSLVIDKESFNIQWNQIEFGVDTITVIRNDVPTVYKIVSGPSATTTKRKLP